MRSASSPSSRKAPRNPVVPVRKMSPASRRVGVRIGGLRSYLGFEDGVGDEIVDSRHLPCLPVALQRLLSCRAALPASGPP